jgi:hypothetical protein
MAVIEDSYLRFTVDSIELALASRRDVPAGAATEDEH